MNEFITWFLETVQSIDPELRILIAGVAVLLETSVLIGLIVPGDTIVIVAGTAVGSPEEGAILILVLVIGALIGESIGYCLGRWVGPKIRASRLGRKLGEHNWVRAERYLRRRGGSAIFLSRFLPVLHSLVPLTVGMSRYSYRRFLAWTAPACLLWSVLYVTVTASAANYYRDLSDSLHYAGYLFVGVIVLFLFLTYLAKRILQRREAQHLLPLRQAPRRTELEPDGADLDAVDVSSLGHNDAMQLPSDDEFRFLVSDAVRVGRTEPLPVVQRVWTGVGDGRHLSALRFSPAFPGELSSAPPPQFIALHGAGLNAHSFDPMLLALNRPALSIDLPGHGRSDWRADGDYRPDRLATDITTALENLAPTPVTLVGHSLGGLAAALVAAAQPGLVRHLVIVDITPGITPHSDAGAVSEFITGQRSYGSVDEIVDRAIRFGIGSDRTSLTRGVSLNTRRRADGRLEWTHHLAQLNGLPAAGLTDHQPSASIWPSLHSLDLPITLIRAESGMVTEAHAAEWRRQLPDTSVITLAGPHNLHEAVPVELAAILAHLDTVEP